MNTILQDGAKAAIWCEPVQQRSYVVAMARLTPDQGAYKAADVIWATVPLPNANLATDRSFYHVFQIGQVPPELFNWALTLGQWANAIDVCQNNNAVITVYMANGTVLPIGSVYVMQNFDRNILVAVRIDPNVQLGTTNYVNNVTGQTLTRGVTMADQQAYIRIYSNDRFDSPNFKSNAPQPIDCIGALTQFVSSQSDYTNFVNRANAMIASYGGVGMPVWYMDGFVSNAPGAYTPAMLNRTWSMFYDESIMRQNFYPCNTLNTFVSTVDPYTSKYVLLADNSYSLIEYAGDIDFYLVLTNANNSQLQGVYIDRSNIHTVRNLTHNAYSIRTDVIQALTLAHGFLSNIANLQIMAMVRDGGQYRGLPNTANRVEELYKLPVAQIAQAMTGVNSLVPEWQAVNLEAAAYSRLMGAADGEITLQLAEQAYGYNAASKYANPVLQAVTPAGNHGQVLATLAQDILDIQTQGSWRSIYAYDATGALLGWSNDQGLSNLIELPVYPVIPTTAEMIPLLGSTTLDGTFFNENVSDWGLTQYGFRAYACDAPSGTPDEIWTDITGSSYYSVAPNAQGIPTLTWNFAALNTAGLFPAVRINKYVHMFTPPAFQPGYPGYIVFSVDSTVTWMGASVSRPQSVPPGTVDVFMDGESLVYGVDYYMAWPQICIVKKPTTLPANMQILVRSYGNANPATVKPYPPREVGFVKGGILSVDGTYNIRNDRNIRVVAGGLMQLPSAVQFAEGASGQLFTDGRPYAVTDYLLPVEPYTDLTTNEWYDTAEDLDTRVENYLTPRINPVPPVFSAVIGDRWEVFSPFLSALIQQFMFGSFLNNGELNTAYTNLDVAGWVAPFTWLLAYDPCHVGVDDNYVVIEPHQYTTVINVTQAQWVFLEYVITNYLSSATRLTPSVAIGP